jgi:hypothetical protein
LSQLVRDPVDGLYHPLLEMEVNLKIFDIQKNAVHSRPVCLLSSVKRSFGGREKTDVRVADAGRRAPTGAK